MEKKIFNKQNTVWHQDYGSIASVPQAMQTNYTVSYSIP